MPQSNPMTDTLEALADRMAANMPADQGDAVDYILAALKSVQNSLPVSPSPPLVEPADAANRESTARIETLEDAVADAIGESYAGWAGDNGESELRERLGELNGRLTPLLDWKVYHARHASDTRSALPICGTPTEREGSEGLPDCPCKGEQK